MGLRASPSTSDQLDLTSDEGQDRLAQLYRYAQVGRCVNSVTHDLNNFLGAIMAYAELVSMEPAISDESRRMLDEIVGGVKRSSDLVNNLTGIARRERLDVNVVHVPKLVQRVTNLRAYDYKVAGVDLRIERGDSDLEVTGDRAKLEYVVLYLLSNALEATANQPASNVRVKVEATPEGARITVYDSAGPINSETAERMFEPFFTTKGEDHLGLGLTTARNIMHLHDGDLQYDPATGFVVHLPRENRFVECLKEND